MYHEFSQYTKEVPPSPVSNNKHNTIDRNTKAGKELTCEALETAQDASTSLALVKGTQLVTNIPPPTPPTTTTE